LSFPGPEFVEDFAGDIAISLDIAAQNAKVRGHSIATELQILALHGVLHLAGYDHESDGGEMTRIEMRMRRKLTLPASLIERTRGQGLRARK
jgi:probable rRNA maturation factor